MRELRRHARRRDVRVRRRQLRLRVRRARDDGRAGLDGERAGELGRDARRRDLRIGVVGAGGAEAVAGAHGAAHGAGGFFGRGRWGW